MFTLLKILEEFHNVRLIFIVSHVSACYDNCTQQSNFWKHCTNQQGTQRVRDNQTGCKQANSSGRLSLVNSSFQSFSTRLKPDGSRQSIRFQVTFRLFCYIKFRLWLGSLGYIQIMLLRIQERTFLFLSQLHYASKQEEQIW